MQFLWPHHLAWMLLLPLLPLLYLWLLRRRDKPALGFPSLEIVRAAAGKPWRRHVPPALVFAALGLLLLALARPTAPISLPWAKSTIWLALDISRSMRVQDVQPTRMVAAQNAAKAFLGALPREIEVGLVTFAGTAQVAQQATRDRPSLVAAIDAIQMQYGTAIGSAIVVSLATIFPKDGIDLRMVGRRPGGPEEGNREQRRDAAKARGGDPIEDLTTQSQKPKAAPGSYDSAVVVLLSDGQSTTGPDPVAAAKLAAERGVRVYTVGVGTAKGEVLRTDGWSMRVSLDEAQLKTVADLTRGEYFQADDAAELKRIYQSMSSRFVMEKKELEIGALFAAGAALLALLAAGLSVAWYGRVL